MNDYLDELIAKNSKDPLFAAKWKLSEARIALTTMRKDANMTQEEVAEKMGVSRPRVSELENRPLSVSFGRMIDYANALGVPIEKIAKTIKRAS